MEKGSRYGSAIILALFLSSSCAIALSSLLQTRGVLPQGSFVDARSYLEMAGGPGDGRVPTPFRYRVLTPWAAARLSPVDVAALDAAANLQLRFALVNVAGLALAAWWLYLWLGRLGFGQVEALVGGLLYLGSFYPLYQWTLPYTDAWAQALLMGGLLLVLDARWLLLAGLFAVALFEKESILLLPAMALFLGLGRRALLRLGLALVPGLAAHGWFRFVAVPDPGPAYWLPSVHGYLQQVFVTGELAFKFAVLCLASFGALWILAALGWRRAAAHPLLARLRWFLPVLLPAPFVLLVGAAKLWFYAFPVVIPLALLGLFHLLGRGLEASSPAAPAPRAR